MSNNGNAENSRQFDKIIRESGLQGNRSKKSSFGPRDKSSSSSDPYMNQFVTDVWDIIDELGNLLISKQRDYGPGNINNAYGGPMNGLLVRMGDKFERLKNLFGFKQIPKHEPIEDSFKDMANYAIIALMIQRGKWPENRK